jgi:hypothetical protein
LVSVRQDAGAEARRRKPAREILGAASDDRPHPRGLLDEMQSYGWGVRAEVPGREVVVGAVTKPWEANVIFRGLSPDGVAAFREPGT